MLLIKLGESVLQSFSRISRNHGKPTALTTSETEFLYKRNDWLLNADLRQWLKLHLSDFWREFLHKILLRSGIWYGIVEFNVPQSHATQYRSFRRRTTSQWNACIFLCVLVTKQIVGYSGKSRNFENLLAENAFLCRGKWNLSPPKTDIPIFMVYNCLQRCVWPHPVSCTGGWSSANLFNVTLGLHAISLWHRYITCLRRGYWISVFV